MQHFTSATGKLHRAEFHIADLERQFKAFVERKPHRFSIKNDEVTRQPMLQVRFVEDIPKTFSVIVGDAVHNLRCAMDHLMWDLIGVDKGRQHKNLQFVCRTDRSNFEGTIKALDTPSQWVKNYLLGIECFTGGKGEAFVTISDLDNADKHRAITPVLRATKHPDFKIFRPDGIVLVTVRDCGSFIGIDGSPNEMRIANIPPGMSVEFDQNTDCTPMIFFDNIRGADAITVLREFKRVVEQLIVDTANAVALHHRPA